MYLILKAAFKDKKHLKLFILSILTLIFLTIAHALEVSALGVLTNSQTVSDLPKKGEEAPIEKQASSPTLLERSVKKGNFLSAIIEKIHTKFPQTNNIFFLLQIIIAVAFLKAITLFFSRYTTQLLAIEISKSLRRKYFEHIQLLSMSFYQKHNIGALSSRIVVDANQIATSINSVLTNYLHTPFTVFVALVVSFIISWQLSLIMYIGFPLIIVPVISLTHRIKKTSRQLQRNQEIFSSLLVDFLAGIQTIKIYAMESLTFKKYNEQNDQMAHLESKTAKYALIVRPILHAITVICFASISFYGIYFLKIALSEIIVFCGILQMAYEAVKKFADENANIQKGIVAAERMNEVLELQPEIKDLNEATHFDGFFDTIEFDNVSFRYESEWILRNLSFTLKKGECIALVGPTGSGKSTVLQLLARLYEPQEGEIRINGKRLDAYTQKSLREQIAFVSQKPFVFCDTIAANICFGRDFSETEVKKAAQGAFADEFIEKLPLKYETLVFEGGQNFSGGQLQRLVIARAFIKKASILVLDEATSSLDGISESRIKGSIQKLQMHVTQIIIAHRLSTIEHADKIIYLDGGKKIGEGTKDELLKTCEPFRVVWEALYQSEDKKV